MHLLSVHPLSVPCLAMAAVNFYVGVYYLIFYLKRRQAREYLPFSLLCLSVAFYDVFCFGLYNSLSISDGVFWQRLQLEVVIAISISLIWFTAIFTEDKDNRIIRILIGWFIIVFLASLFANPDLTLTSSNPAIKSVGFFNLLKITYYEGKVGVFFLVEIISAVIAQSYLLYLFLRHYQKTQYKGIKIIIFGQVMYFLTVVNDSLVASQVYSFIYLSEYAFFFIVFAMAYILLDRFVNLHSAFEELNINLEKKILERTSRIRKLNKDLKNLAERDGLTGVYNRRFFNEYLEIEIKRVKSHREYKPHLESSPEVDLNFGLAIIDIDHFKQINDKYGHQVGDTVLKQTTDIIDSIKFPRDVLCRYGGDEFVLLLTKTSSSGNLKAMEKIRKEIDQRVFVVDKNNTDLHITVSVGLANYYEIPNQGGEELLKLADKRLLRAKSLGRNRTVYSESD